MAVKREKPPPADRKTKGPPARAEVAASAAAEREAAVEALRQSADVVSVATRVLGLNLKADGAERFKAHCPMPGHGPQSGNSPPFTLYRGGGFKCFGCDARGGDGISLFAQAKGLDERRDFPRIVEELGPYFGATIPTDSNKGHRHFNISTAPKPASTSTKPSPSRDPKPDELALHREHHRPPDCSWQIRNVEGNLVAVHCRWNLPAAQPGGKPDKTFAWWRNGAWSLRREGVSACDVPLYGTERIPSFDPGRPLFFVEGEKACDALVEAFDAQAIATCTSHGDGPLAPLASWPGPIILWADADPEIHGESTGLKTMRDIAARLRAFGATDVRIFLPAGLPPKGDAVEWIQLRPDLNAAREELLREVAELPAFTATTTSANTISAIPAGETGANSGTPAIPPVRFVTARQFIAAPEDAPVALLGTIRECVISDQTTFIIYGDGGAGKTSLTLDYAAHACSGASEWLRLPLRRQRIGVVEMDGPRAPFRLKVGMKREAWDGAEFLDDLLILEEPWGRFTLGEEQHRQALAELIDLHDLDMVILGPLAEIGAEGGGTPAEVSAFGNLVDDLRARTARKFALGLIHHENRTGRVSGAWERFPDTLMHVENLGSGMTRLHWRKVRWSSPLHGTDWRLAWDGAGGFQREERVQARDYRGELLEVFQDGKWHPLTEAAELIHAHPNKARPILSALVETGVLTYQKGVPGFARNSKCYRLAACTEAPDKPVQAVQAAIPECS